MTDNQKQRARELVRAGMPPGAAMRKVLGLYTPYRPAPPRLPELKPGADRATMLRNSLRLMRAGLSKHQAMAHALNAAGFRPRGS